MLNGSIAKQNTSKRVINLSQNWIHLKTWFFLLPAFKLAITETYPILDKLYSLWGLFALFLLMVIATFHVRMERKSIMYASFMVIFCVIYSVMTKVYTPVSFLGSVSQSARILLFPFYLAANRNADYKQLLNSISILWKVILFADSITIFIDYDGKLEYSLLGLDNTVIFLIIPLLTIIMFTDYYRCGKFSRSSIAVFAICILGKLYSQAVTSCLAIAVFVMAYYIVLSKKNSLFIKTAKKYLNPTIMFGFFVLFTTLTLLFDLTPFFAKIFGIFGKDGTLSGRTKIWAVSADSIFKNPIIGHGQATPVYFQKFVGLSIWAKSATHTHNFALELLWSTGIIGTFFFMYLFVMAIRKLYKYREFKAVQLLSCGFTAFCVLMITDSYIMQPAVIILCFLCLNIEKILIQKVTKSN